MSDRSILQHINSLVEEEQQLRGPGRAGDADGARLREVEQQLDQCWDLLRQRRALREFGDDPNTAKPRDVGTVEGYEG